MLQQEVLHILSFKESFLFKRDNGNVHRAAAKIIVSKSRAARGSVCNVLLSRGFREAVVESFVFPASTGLQVPQHAFLVESSVRGTHCSSIASLTQTLKPKQRQR